MRPQEAALPLASKVAPVPDASDEGVATAAIGCCAASTALKALTMPLPHSPEAGQEHSSVEASRLGQTGKFAVLAGNALALDSMRAPSCVGVKLALTARIKAAIPATMGVAKLVPRFSLVSLV